MLRLLAKGSRLVALWFGIATATSAAPTGSLPEWAVPDDPPPPAKGHPATIAPAIPPRAAAASAPVPAGAHAPAWPSVATPADVAHATGRCNVRVGADRTAIELVDPDGGDVRHLVALGRDRVEAVYRSDDERWAVAVIKAREGPARVGQAIDRAGCRASASFALASAPVGARFAEDRVELRYADGSTQAFALEAP